ncbi:MAG: FxsA family protein [Solirubrobacteraceae bacterium]|nr:FxsA family protein [Solirubrobacteraceae bacterium]
MLPLLLILFVAVPVAELYVIIKVGQWIGVLPTVALLVADSMAGALLLRAQGRSAWRRFTAAVAEGRVPTREVLDGVCVIAGGLAMLAPGFITDAVGILLLLPPTRAVFRRVALANVATRMAAQGASWGAGRMRARWSGPAARRPYDVDGTAREHEPERLP